MIPLRWAVPWVDRQQQQRRAATGRRQHRGRDACDRARCADVARPAGAGLAFVTPWKTQPKTLLVTLTGKDRPGVTSAIFAALAAAGVEVLDIEQIVLRRRLVLGVLVTAPRDWKKLRDVIERTAADLGMSVEVDRGAGDNRSRARRPLPRHRHRHARCKAVGDGRDRRPDRRLAAPTSTGSSGWRATR